MSKIDIFNDHTYVTPEFFEYLRMVEKALSGDIVLVLSPATTGSKATAIAAAVAAQGGKFIRTVKFELQDAAGNIHTWFSGDIALTSADVTAGDGESAIADEATNVTLKEGVGSVDIEYSGAWAAADTNTLTTTQRDICGVTITAKTSIDTVIA